MDDTASYENSSPPLFNWVRYPWYVHLFGGYALTGAFCWLLVAGLFWRSRRRLIAATLLGVNLMLLTAMIWSTFRLGQPWWRLESLTLGVNLAWALSAWLMQYRFFGAAERRYRLAEWRRWRLPLITGALLGSGVAVGMAVSPAVGERIAALSEKGVVVRDSILWQFFKDLPMGLALGLLVGAWWAGCRRFTSSHVIGFLAGIAVTLAAETAFFGLFAWIVHQGEMASLQMLSHESWALVPGPLTGWHRFLSTLSDLNYIAYIPVGILFGAPARLGVFFKRSAVIVPLLILLCLSFFLSTDEGWALVQGRFVYQTASSDERERETAFDWLHVLLARYPNHGAWPHLAARLADYQYARGETEASRRLHQQIVDRFSNLNQWKTQVAISRSILAAPSFGEPPVGPRLAFSLVNYQDYLTQNWMALLTAARYWQGDEIPESDLLVRLRDISKSDDRIKLPDLTSLADLDDAASSLGYGLTIVPNDAQAARALIRAGIPVVLPVYQTFYLLSEFDDSRGVVKTLCFGQLSEKTKSLAAKETQEILMLKSEGHGHSKDRLRRIGREAECLWHLDHWRTGRLKDAAPLMAAIHPPDGHKSVAAALGLKEEALCRAHRGRLAALIALSYFDHADPQNCIRWSQIAAQSIDEPLAWQAAYLGLTLWDQRAQRIGTAFQLEKQFTTLDDINRFLETESVRQFSQSVRERLADDLADGGLTWPIRWRMLWLLDRHDLHERRQMIELLQANVATNPADAAQWRLLADLQALNDDPVARAYALAEAWSAAPWDTDTALAWAGTCARLNDPQRVERILQGIDPSKARHDSEYFFCLAAVAEWKKQFRAALSHYCRATEMCRYRPEYYLRYGRLLMAQGDTKAAEKALGWAARIDSSGQVGKQALNSSSGR